MVQNNTENRVTDRPPFGRKDDERLERKEPDRNILDRERIEDGLKKWGLVIVFGALVLIFSILEPVTFLSGRNAINILNNSAPLILLSLAATVALTIGEFDLSFPNVADLVGVVVGVLVTSYGFSSGMGLLGAVAIGFLVAAAIGALNGFLVAKVFVPSFVATLAIGSIAGGFELASQAGIGNGMKQISQIVLPPLLQDIGRATVMGGPIKWSVVIAFAVAILLWGAMRGTTPGRRAYALGGNPMGAYLAGVPVAWLRVGAFTLVALLAASAGLINLAERGYFNGASPPLLLQSYTAAFLGAAVLTKKKRFDILGTLFAVFVLLVLTNGLSLMNQPRWISNVISGIVLLVAVILNRPKHRKV
ncbi:MAG: ABC transporter permease [Maritimibacter sp.]